jgi:hypothetical protein
MKFSCPNKNTPEWKALVRLSDDSEMKAYKAFIKNNYNIPQIEKEIDDVIGKAVVEALKVTTKRIKILEGAYVKGKGSELKALKKIENELVEKLVNDEHEAGLLFFTNQIGDEIDKIKEELNAGKQSMAVRSSQIRTSLSYIDALLPMIDDINNYLALKDNRTEAEEEIYKVLTSKGSVLNALRNKVVESGRDVLTMLLEPLLGQRNDPKLLAEINKGLPPHKQLKEFDILSALKKGQDETGILDRWFRSMANNGDELLRLFNEVIMRKKTEARLESLKDRYKILDIRNEYFKATGSRDFDFIYERRKDGTLTGNFIDSRRWNEWTADRYKFQNDYLASKGVKSEVELSESEQRKFTEAKNKWLEDNSDYVEKSDYAEVDGMKSHTTKKKPIPSLVKYGNENFTKLNEHQTKALTEIKKLKLELDQLIHPKFRHKYRVPQVSKDFYERFKNLKNADDIKEWVGSAFFNKDYDLDKGTNVDDGTVAYVLDDNGREVEFIPMHFTRKLEDLNRNLSTDIISSMVVYSHMARDYNAMNSIVDSLEVAREVLRERKIVQHDNKGAVKKTISYVAGTKITNDLFSRDNGAFKRFEDFLSMIVYGKTRVNTGTFTVFGKEFDKEKALDALAKYTAINSLALNIYAGIANLGIGNVTTRIDASAGVYFGHGDLNKGTIDYYKDLPDHLSQIGKVHNTSKLALWSDRFDPLQDFESSVHETKANRSTWFARSISTSALFFINHAGEHYMQTRTSLALANSTKLKTKDGTEISLYDAYEVKDGRLVLKQGVTKLDGTEWTREDEITFMRRQDFINQRMHGIYNHNDMAAIQKYALGRLGMMFRKFMVPGFDRRFEATNYNYMLGDFTEGYYKTTANFMAVLMKDLVHFKFSIMKNWDQLNDMRKANVKKSMTEVAFLLSIMTFLTFVLGGDDDGETDWLRDMMDYQAKRLRTEMLFFLDPRESFRILQSPSAAIRPVNNAFDFVASIINPIAWNDRYQSGRYKDWLKWQKQGLMLLPLYRTIDKAFHPDEAVKFFNQ